jgi:regulator of RNase E activity RraA
MEMDHTPEDPYEMEIAFMDSLQTGDVAIHSTDSAGTNAPWGELMSTVAQRNGAAGCVCDSQIRDCVKIIELGFPVYYTGIRPLDSKGRARVMAYDIPVKCGDVLVKTGDIIFADFDGIVVVPEEISEEVFRRSAEKVNSENLSRKELMEGKTLRDVYEKYHAL